MERILYFAYGTNLNREQMAKRCPEFEFVSNAQLHSYRLDNTSYNVANIIKDPNGVVDGVIYSLSINDLNNLDQFEGTPFVYQRVNVKVNSIDGNQYRCFVYILQEEILIDTY